jgi:predicted AAA+ superfamily ATPase
MAIHRIAGSAIDARHHGIDGWTGCHSATFALQYRRECKSKYASRWFSRGSGSPKSRALWFASYLQTYLERDVRAITNVRDLVTFRRFLALLASRHGQILNKTDLSAPLGVSVPTISEWLHVLEITSQVILVPPYFENLGRRLIKSPKIYWGDPGFACYLLGIASETELQRSPFLGQLFEGLVAAEILKSQVNRGARKELYYFRDQQGLGSRLSDTKAERRTLAH